MMPAGVSRRQFLQFAGLATTAAVVAACGATSAPTTAPAEAVTQAPEATAVPTTAAETAAATTEATTAAPEAATAPGKYNEAPMLADLVKAGELPPVEERLPAEPLVLTQAWNEMPSDELDLVVGQYGGTLNTVQPDPAWNPDLFIMNNEPPLRSPGLGIDDIRGNVFKAYEASEDNKTFTFHLREGLKWSDGMPVTTEDVLFAWEDVILDENLTPVFPVWLRAGSKSDGDPLELKVIDDFTFSLASGEPYGRLPVQLALTGWRGYTDLLKPKHFMQAYHVRYTPLEELEPLITEAGLAKGEWWTLFQQKDVPNWDLCQAKAVGFPSLCPWLVVESAPTATIYRRNPYYFKVDAEGNQLPYIDGIRSAVVADVEMGTMKLLAGEVDFLREDTALKDLPLYKENEEKAGFRVVELLQHVNPTTAWLNLTYNDVTWRQVVGDLRFRKALNLGIDYEEIIDAVYMGFGTPPTTVPGVHDPEAANQLLDEMGMDQRDGDGLRLGPDGKTFVISFEVAMHAPDIVPVTELIVEYWTALGVKTTMKTIDAGLLSTRQEANEIQATVVWDVEPMWRTGGWLDFRPSNQWAPLWWLWYTSSGKEGEEPPAEVKRILDISELIMQVTPASAEDQALFDELFKILYDNVYFFMTSEDSVYPVVVSKRLGNVPHAGFGIAADLAGEQLYFME